MRCAWGLHGIWIDCPYYSAATRKFESTCGGVLDGWRHFVFTSSADVQRDRRRPVDRWGSLCETFVIVAVPAIFILFLIVLPLVAPGGERSPIRRPWSIVLVIFMVSAIGYYWHKGIEAPWSPHMDAPPLRESVVGVNSGPIAGGAKVFYDKGCEFCRFRLRRNPRTRSLRFRRSYDSRRNGNASVQRRS